MLDDALAHLKGQVQPRELHVLLLEFFNDAQRLQVVVEALRVAGHQPVEQFLARVPERRVAHVVDERQGLDQFRVQPQRLPHRAADLRHLERVRQAVAKMVRVTAREDLRLVLEPPESARVDDPVAVALVFAAVGVRRLGVAPPERAPHVHRVAGKLILIVRAHRRPARGAIALRMRI